MTFKTLFTLVLLNSMNLMAQETDSITVIYTIIDEDRIPIQGVIAKIEQSENSFEVVSNVNGEAICKVEKFGELKTSFLHPLYAKLTTIDEIYRNSRLDTIRFRIALTSITSLDLEEVKVVAPGVPQLVFSSEQLSVQDYEIVDKHNIVLLAYPKRLEKGSQLLLYDPVKQVRDSVEVDGEAIELIRDYEGHIYLVCTTGCKRILISDGSIETYAISKYYVNRFIIPIIGTVGNKMIFSTYDALYPAFDYYSYNVDDSSYAKIASVIDEEMMEQYRSEYKFVDMHDPIAVRKKLAAKNYELATGVDASVIYGRRYFTKSIFYEAPFAPMFKVNDSLYLFDYHCDSLKRFNKEGKLASETFINHDHNQRKEGWQKELIQDRVTNEIYALYERGGYYYLNPINLKSGELSDPIKLNNRYADEVQVYNGFIYYVYRPFESYQKKYFWREKLPN